jgi:hypothetical protein
MYWSSRRRGRQTDKANGEMDMLVESECQESNLCLTAIGYRGLMDYFRTHIGRYPDLPVRTVGWRLRPRDEGLLSAQALEACHIFDQTQVPRKIYHDHDGHSKSIGCSRHPQGIAVWVDIGSDQSLATIVASIYPKWRRIVCPRGPRAIRLGYFAHRRVHIVYFAADTDYSTVVPSRDQLCESPRLG